MPASSSIRSNLSIVQLAFLVSLSRAERKFDDELCSVHWEVISNNRAMVFGDDSMRNGQSKSGSTLFRRGKCDQEQDHGDDREGRHGPEETGLLVDDNLFFDAVDDRGAKSRGRTLPEGQSRRGVRPFRPVPYPWRPSCSIPVPGSDIPRAGPVRRRDGSIEPAGMPIPAVGALVRRGRSWPIFATLLHSRDGLAHGLGSRFASWERA